MSDTLVYPFIRLAPVFSLTPSPLTNTYDIHLHVLAVPRGFAPFSNREPILLGAKCQPRGPLISTRALFFSPLIFLVLSLGVFVLVVYQSITDPPFALSG